MKRDEDSWLKAMKQTVDSYFQDRMFMFVNIFSPTMARMNTIQGPLGNNSYILICKCLWCMSDFISCTSTSIGRGRKCCQMIPPSSLIVTIGLSHLPLRDQYSILDLGEILYGDRRPTLSSLFHQPIQNPLVLKKKYRDHNERVLQVTYGIAILLECARSWGPNRRQQLSYHCYGVT